MANLIDNDALIVNERVEGFGQSSIIRITGGRIYVGHVNNSGDLEIHYSDNAGSSWTLDTTFNEAQNIDMFSFTVSDLDDVFLTYSFATAADVYTLKVKKRDHTAGTWSEILNETSLDSAGVILKPLITWNRKALLTRLHVFWLTHATGSSSVYIDNKYTNNYGTSWTSGTQFNYTLSSDQFTVDTIDSLPSSGELYILMRKTNVHNIAVQWVYNSTGLRTGQKNTAELANRWQYGNSSAIDSNGDTWLINFSREYYAGNYTLKVWKNETSLSLTILDSVSQTMIKGMLSIGIDGSDNVYIFYVKIADEKCYYRKYDAGTATWGTEIVVTTGDGKRIGCEQHSLIGSAKLHLSYYTD